MLFKLSMRNIRRSLKDYLIYFFTLVLGVAVFYVFNSLESQSIMMNVSSNTHRMIGLMTSIMSVLSVFVAIVLGFLIIYANRFLMKRRKREFGIYMTLGMGKGQISKILLIETLSIGLLSLVIGLVAGIFLSQLMSIFVANLFEADMTNFQFVFSTSALATTVALFAIIFLIVMIFNTLSVSKQKLINLIHSDKTSEQVKVRNLPASLIVFAVSVFLLTTAYIGVTGDISKLDEANIITYIVMGIVGTFMLFWSWSGLALRLFKRFKGFYYRNLNPFIFRELSSKINTTVISMSIISLLLFLTICIFSSAMSIKNSMTANLQTLAPADFQSYKYINLSNRREDPETDPDQLRRESLTITQTLAELGVSISEYFSDYATVSIHSLESVTYRQTVGEAALRSIGGLTDETIGFMLSSRENIIFESDYNALARIYGFDSVDLSSDEYAVAANYESSVKSRNIALRDSAPVIDVLGRTLHPKYREVKNGFLEMSSSQMESGLLIVPDDIDLASHVYGDFFVGNYLATDDDSRLAVDRFLTEEILAPDTWNAYHLTGTTKTVIYEDSIGLSAMVTFIGLYLGVIFLITSAALLGLKEVSESSDNQGKYKTLRDLGVSQKSMNRTLLVQIAIFFGMPLLVACIHSIFGIIFANKIISTFTSFNLLSSITLTAALIIAIYGGYFLITYHMSKRIILTRD